MKLAAEGDQIRDEARKAAGVEQSALMQQVQAEISKVRQAADIQAKQERIQMQRDLESNARQLAVIIASHLLARFSQQAQTGDLFQNPSNWLANLPQRDLQNLAESGETLEVVTAVALEPAARAACSQILQHRLAREVNLQFSSAPELIAGLELRSPRGRLRNNWRADLDRILEELSRDEQHLAVA